MENYSTFQQQTPAVKDNSNFKILNLIDAKLPLDFKIN